MKKLLTFLLVALMAVSSICVVGCNKPCTEHDFDGAGNCKKCTYVCKHDTYTNSICDECGLVCAHDKALYYKGECVCGVKCQIHDYENDECTVCGTTQQLKATTESKLTCDVVNNEQVYTLTKTVPGNCNQYSDNAFWIANPSNAYNYVTFEFYSDDFNYFQLTSGDGTGYMNFNVYGRTKCINMADNSEVVLDREADGGIWTGEVLPTGTWLKFVVDIWGIKDLGFVFWSSHEGTAKMKNIEFHELKKKSEENIAVSFDADGNLVYQLIKINDVESLNYAQNAIYVKLPGNRNVVSFDIKNTNLDYLKLYTGNGYDTYSEISFADKVVIKNKETDENVVISETNWTGNVLATNVWYTVTVDVSGATDLGIAFDLADFEISYLCNIQFK